MCCREPTGSQSGSARGCFWRTRSQPVLPKKRTLVFMLLWAWKPFCLKWPAFIWMKGAPSWKVVFLIHSWEKKGVWWTVWIIFLPFAFFFSLLQICLTNVRVCLKPAWLSGCCCFFLPCLTILQNCHPARSQLAECSLFITKWYPIQNYKIKTNDIINHNNPFSEIKCD